MYIIKPKFLPSNSLMTILYVFVLTLNVNFLKYCQISSLLTLAKRLCCSYSSTSLANIKSKSSFHHSEIPSSIFSTILLQKLKYMSLLLKKSKHFSNWTGIKNCDVICVSILTDDLQPMKLLLFKELLYELNI